MKIGESGRGRCPRTREEEIARLQQGDLEKGAQGPSSCLWFGSGSGFWGRTEDSRSRLETAAPPARLLSWVRAAGCVVRGGSRRVVSCEL